MCLFYVHMRLLFECRANLLNRDFTGGYKKMLDMYYVVVGTCMHIVGRLILRRKK